MVSGRASAQFYARPTTTEALAEAVREAGPFHLIGSGTKVTDFGLLGGQSAAPPAGTRMVLSGLSGILEWDVADGVVVVRAGTTIREIQTELATRGQTLPLPNPQEHHALLAGLPGTVGGSLSMNLPHALEGQCGSWREWVLGMTVVRADGTIVRCGSKAVKNVAGYDVQKLLIGARGTLGIVAEVILRTFPVRALPRPRVRRGRSQPYHPLWIQRMQRWDFAEAVEAAGDRLIAADEATSTLWAQVPAGEELPRWLYDWVLRSGCGVKNLELRDPTQVMLMKRAKAEPRGDGHLLKRSSTRPLTLPSPPEGRGSGGRTIYQGAGR